MKQDVLLQVLAIIHKHNADIAFPTQTLKIDPQDFSNVQGHNSVQSLGDNQNVSDPKDMLNSPTEGHR